VFPQSALTGTAARLSVDIRRFPWIRPLAADYAYNYDALAPFFAGNPAQPAAWHDAIARVSRHPRDREALARLVQNQQARRGAPPESMAAAAQLSDSETVAIVTGQQAGLFGGPLFTLLKAITAIRLAERVRSDYRIQTVAVFWIDSEDHDWNEVKACGVLDHELDFHRIAIGDPPGAHERPVARVQLDRSVNDAIEQLQASLSPTEFTANLLKTLGGAYREGTGASEAFGRWLESVLGPRGLIVYDAADPSAKGCAAPLFAREIEDAGETARLAAEAGSALEGRGYHAQVAPQTGNLALFHLDGGRAAIRVDGGGFRVGNSTETKAALLDKVNRAPEEFSPNVLLRPVLQDALFPTVCYVAGPNELAYLGQLAGVYKAFGVPMPLIQQRSTATLVDSNAMRFLTRYNLSLETLQPQNEAALNGLLASQLPPGVEAALIEAARAIEEHMDALARAVLQIDSTLESATRSTLGRMSDDLKKLHAKIIQGAKRKDDTLRRQFKHAQAQAFPGGGPQEREIGFVYFLNKYGPGLVDRLGEELPLDMGLHWVLAL
jgi:bacillithiol biosynthesis cysteine-adding enzyme BshC